MANFLKLHLHPLGGRLIFWNFVLLILVKLVFPHSAFQSASLLGLTPTFDSREIINATNEARTASHLPELKPNAKLDLAADEKLNDMAVKEYFAHVSPSGTNPWHWIKNNQYQYSVAGENLAIGFFTAQDTVQAWFNSPSHKANVLNSQYQDIGVAVKGVEINGREGILVVQMFGSPHLSSGVAGSPARLAEASGVAQAVVLVKEGSTKTPSPTPQLALNTPKPATILGESIAIAQEISTDTSIEPVHEPIAIRLTDTEKIAKASRLLNNVFSLYAVFIATTSAVAFFFFEKNRNMAFKMAFNFTLFALAIILPAAKISFSGLIF